MQKLLANSVLVAFMVAASSCALIQKKDLGSRDKAPEKTYKVATIGVDEYTVVDTETANISALSTHGASPCAIITVWNRNSKKAAIAHLTTSIYSYTEKLTPIYEDMVEKLSYRSSDVDSLDVHIVSGYLPDKRQVEILEGFWRGKGKITLNLGNFDSILFDIESGRLFRTSHSSCYAKASSEAATVSFISSSDILGRVGDCSREVVANSSNTLSNQSNIFDPFGHEFTVKSAKILSISQESIILEVELNKELESFSLTAKVENDDREHVIIKKSFERIGYGKYRVFADSIYPFTVGEYKVNFIKIGYVDSENFHSFQFSRNSENLICKFLHGEYKNCGINVSKFNYSSE
jgi:hypothetical protein